MKILSNGVDSITPIAQLFQPASGPVETISFASLLRSDGLVAPAQRRQSQEAVSFDALGVFGRYGAGAETWAGMGMSFQAVEDNKAVTATNNKRSATKELQAIVTSATPAVTINNVAHQDVTGTLSCAAGREMAGSSEPTQTFATFAYEAGTTSATAVSSVGSTALDPASVNDEPVSGAYADMGAEPGSGAGIPETDEVAVADGPVQEQRAEIPQGNSDASVSIAGADSALNVIVRGNLLQEGSSPLREMIENTAAEFGMKVSRLWLNGGETKSSATASGGQNGSHTR